ncbi:hypothetical protein EV673_2326 [Limnobacter thiooxidans]|uniref:Uncharacterized protein n=1 Tax=Limnobacter thiooxidans TaxID=131080 RepID=A0AA86JLT0_9BURK|nr:hypothetical protein EV673_2326 [Limnobacter thiooxidans]BET27007.1 hypothetical protein RGQ30_25080 [Limnobacter thiooxidans]
MTAKPVAGLRPNVACEFKRAGFLEWRNDWNIAADRLKTSGDLWRVGGFNPVFRIQSGCVAKLSQQWFCLLSHFKKPPRLNKA